MRVFYINNRIIKMKSFAAAASMAAIASGAQVMTPGNKRQAFADAFVTGFTGITDSSTVDACFNDDSLMDQTLAATSLIKVNDYMRGFHRIYKIWNENAQGNQSCMNHKYFWNEDSVMGKWRNVQLQPTVAAETLVNNWTMNKDVIIDAINRFEGDLAADDYTSAGETLAEVLQYALGNVAQNSTRATEFLSLAEEDGVDDNNMVELVKNFISQVIYLNHFDSLKDCSVDTMSLITDLR